MGKTLRARPGAPSQIRSRPLFWAALALAAGIAAGRAALLGVPAAAGVALLGAVMLGIGRRYSALRVAGVFVAVVATGVALENSRRGEVAIDARWIEVVRLETAGEYLLRIDDDPAARNGRIVTRATALGKMTSGGMDTIPAATFLMLLTLEPGDTLLPLARREIITAWGTPRSMRGYRNPGEPDRNALAAEDGLAGRFAIRGARSIRLLGREPAGMMERIAAPIRDAIRGAIERHIGGEEAEFLRGLILGERSGVSDEVRESFVATGTFHVLAVSGLHVGYVCAILFAILSPLPWRSLRTVLLIVGIALYAAIAGAAPPIVRAALMSSLVLAGSLLERRVDARNTIGAAALVLLVIDPGELWHAGFQLSFAAVLGLATLGVRFARWTDAIVIEATKSRRRLRAPLLWTARLLCASTAAQLATLPLLALHFGRLSLIGAVANFVVIPGAGVVLGFGLLTAAAGSISSMLGDIFGAGAVAVTAALLRSVDALAALPLSDIPVPPFGAAESALYLAAVLAVGTSRTAGHALLRGAVALVIWVAAAPMHRSSVLRESGALTVSVLDVGQGDAILLTLPSGGVALIDAGPLITDRWRSHPVAALLRREGIRAIDALILTHLHADHIGGAAAVARAARIGRILHGGERSTGFLARSLDSIVSMTATEVRCVRAGDTIELDPRVRAVVLHPDARAVDSVGMPELGNMNNGSIVIRIEYGATSMLLAGDVEAIEEERMVSRYRELLRADVLKVPHHGSKTSSMPALLDAVRPRIAVVSVGENRFGHPSPPVLARYRERGIEVLRTDSLGAVVLRSDGAAWKRVQW